MKKFALPLLLFTTFAFTACGNQQESAEDQAVIMEIEKTNTALEESIESIDSSAAELEAAIDSLDALFPEE